MYDNNITKGIIYDNNITKGIHFNIIICTHLCVCSSNVLNMSCKGCWLQSILIWAFKRTTANLKSSSCTSYCARTSATCVCYHFNFDKILNHQNNFHFKDLMLYNTSVWLHNFHQFLSFFHQFFIIISSIFIISNEFLSFIINFYHFFIVFFTSSAFDAILACILARTAFSCCRASRREWFVTWTYVRTVGT